MFNAKAWAHVYVSYGPRLISGRFTEFGSSTPDPRFTRDH